MARPKRHKTTSPSHNKSWSLTRYAEPATRNRSLAVTPERVDPKAGDPPDGWPGWPDGKKFTLVLTHDVETAKGQDNCRKLMELEEKLGFRSSFGFVPERYPVSPELRKDLEKRIVDFAHKVL